jgi:hypothetical protein
MTRELRAGGSKHQLGDILRSRTTVDTSKELAKV